MGFKCGIVGLPNVGKSTLFNALTKTANAQAANYPFCTIEPTYSIRLFTTRTANLFYCRTKGSKSLDLS